MKIQTLTNFIGCHFSVYVIYHAQIWHGMNRMHTGNRFATPHTCRRSNYNNLDWKPYLILNPLQHEYKLWSLQCTSIHKFSLSNTQKTPCSNPNFGLSKPLRIKFNK